MRDDRLFLEVPVASRYVVRILEHRLGPTGIPPYQLGLVTHIRHAQPVTPTAIAAVSGVPLTTLRDNIQRLVDGGLVQRIAHPTDGRSYELELTAQGEVMARAADPVLAEAYAALERLLPKPLDHYQAAVGELNAALERVLEEIDLAEATPARTRCAVARGPPAALASVAMPRVAAIFVNTTYDERDDGEFEGSALARIHITRTFSGDVDGNSTGELMTVRSADGSAAYVAFDRVAATIGGKVGAFVFQHWGTITADGGRIAGTVVPGSGAGELAGIEGEGTIRVDDEGTHTLELDYRLPG